jgi:CheY-like chemotaxis protein
VDGAAAMDFVREEGSRANPTIPDLVVLDLNLPKAHRREILAAMRASQKFADVRVVIWTSSNTPRDRDQLASLRIEQYIVKPAMSS